VKSSVVSNLILVSKQAHPLGRLCFALGLFAAVLLMPKDISLMLAALCINILLLYLVCAAWQPLLRAAKLLMWLLVPIFLLHLLFTPGQLLWPGSGVPFTREGLLEGVWLALRLCALFYAAMLLSRSLRREEWVFYCLRLPVFGVHLLPYIKLSSPIRALVSRCMAEAKQQLSESGGLRNVSRALQVLAGLVVRVWRGTAMEAKSVWQAWDENIPVKREQGGIVSALFLILGGLSMPLAVLMH
jgi:hypothetical protein